MLPKHPKNSPTNTRRQLKCPTRKQLHFFTRLPSVRSQHQHTVMAILNSPLNPSLSSPTLSPSLSPSLAKPSLSVAIFPISGYGPQQLKTTESLTWYSPWCPPPSPPPPHIDDLISLPPESCLHPDLTPYRTDCYTVVHIRDLMAFRCRCS